MGHISAESYAGIGGPGIANVVGTGTAGRRQLEAVRRGAVRQRPQQVTPSAWEHVEVQINAGLDRISSLALEPSGSFQASICEQFHDSAADEARRTVAAASGSWRARRGGVELVFASAPELDLPELAVQYALRRGGAGAASECLVAQDVNLPDGLAQEYSPVLLGADGGDGGANLTHERSNLIARMLTDAASLSSPVATARPVVPEASTGEVTWPATADSDDDVREGTAPVGIIQESDSDNSAEDWVINRSGGAGSPSRGAVTAEVVSETGICKAHSGEASGGDVQCSRGSGNGTDNIEDSSIARKQDEDGGEEYCDDFEGESDGD